MEVKGRDLVSGIPKTVRVHSAEVREAVRADPAIVDSVRRRWSAPRRSIADIVDRGIVITGGGALIRGLDKMLTEETGLPVHVAEDPLSAVAEGTGAVLNDLSWLMQNA